MIVTNLKDSPEFVQKTLKLIEQSFGYEQNHHFNVDFYPLFNKKNFENCYIIIENDQVLAHIGSLKRNIELKNEKYSINMYGGIAVAENARGKGYFKILFNQLLELDQESTLSILWSEKVELYEKFSFYPCVQLNSYSQKISEIPTNYKIEKTKLLNLSMDTREQVKKLYQSHKEIRLNRNDTHWDELANITSSVLYLIKSKDEIINYFFLGKGQDLANTVHEYAIIDEQQLKIMQNFGQVWTPYITKDISYQPLFGSIIRINNHDLFKQFIKNYGHINIIHINEDVILFEFEDEKFELPIKEFLLGIFGPGRFKELEMPYLCISGLDSI